MMKIKTVTVEISKKVSARFQSFGNSVALTADLEESEDADAVVRQLQKQAVGLLLTPEKTPSARDSDHQTPKKEESQ